MMSTQIQGSLMPVLRVLIVSALMAVPPWALSQPPAAAKGASGKTASTPTAADVTARLQAQAIAAAARVANSVKPPNTSVVHAAAAPEASVRALSAWVATPALASPQAAAMVTPEPPLAKPDTVPVSPEMAIAQQIHQGLLPCELGASVRVEADAARPGFFNVQGKGFRYRMYPVQTSTGALRLEDKKAGAVWLQLANKSMLMDQKKGRRVADDCAHPEQAAYGQATKHHPQPDLFDTTGMGRAPD